MREREGPKPQAWEGEGAMAGYSQTTLEHAKRLRRETTDCERALWRHIRGSQLGHKFRRQQPIGRYIADFVSQEHRLIVEVDGSQHADSERDAVRDAWLERARYRVMRFWNSDVNANMEGVLTAIMAALEAPPHPNPSPSRGEGLIGGSHG